MAALLLATTTPWQTMAVLAAEEPQIPPAIEAALKKQESHIHKGPVNVRKGSRQVKHFVPKLHFSNTPTDKEISSARVFEEPLIPITGSKSGTAANKALADALISFKGKTGQDDVSDLTAFLAAHPQSPFRASLELNLGLRRAQTGHLSEALELFRSSWEQSKSETGAHQKAIADRAVTELLILSARLGRTSSVKQLLAEIKGRTITGSNEERLSGAREGLSCMKRTPGKAFKCGPFALRNVLKFLPHSENAFALFTDTKSTSKGTNLAHLKDLADQAGMQLQMAKRSKGAPFLTPAVMHWKVGHFAAIVGKEAGRLHLKDPTFGVSGDMRVTPATLESETDGYFLVAAGPLPEGWQPVSKDEAATVWGRGMATNRKHGPPCINSVGSCNNACPPKNSNGPSDDPPHCQCSGMASSFMSLMEATLNIADTPLGYSPPVGSAISFRVFYSHLMADQPATYTFSNLGEDWGLNWISYLTLDGSNNATIRLRNGGSEITNYPYTRDLLTQALLVDEGSGVYHRELPDGTVEVFDQADGSGRIFLTSITDPQGNTISLQYDTDFRLTSVTDAISQVSTISYVSDVSGNAGFYKIASITDPFGRSCSFAYDSNVERLTSITDVIGLTSSFRYDTDTSFIVLMTTPYGSTAFMKYETPYYGASSRGIRTMYPDGTVSVVENWLEEEGQTYYWDRHAMEQYPLEPNTATGSSQYAHATNIAFLKDLATETLCSVRDYTKKPLEAKISYTYPDQPGIRQIGSINKPSEITQSAQHSYFQYNSVGMMTQSQDQIGRIFSYEYDTNGIDLLSVKETKGSDNDILVQYQSYNSQHLPATKIDASGQKTQYTYNSAGQVLTITDPAGNVTTNTYDSNGYLTQIDGPLSGSDDVTSFTYDSYGRLETTTDSEGMTLTFEYDDMNRPTKVTHDDGTFEQIVYDRLDAVMVKDRIGRWTQSAFDNMDRKVYTIDPAGRKVQYVWCSCGSLKSLTDASDHTTRWQHDLEGKTILKTFPDGTTVSYGYDASYGYLTSRVDARGQTTSWSYNLDNTVHEKYYNGAINSTSNVYYTYDSNYNRLTSVKNGWGTISYAYNPHINDATAVSHLWVGGLPTTGDLVNVTVVNSTLPGGQHNVQYTVLSSDTTLTTLASSIKSALNSDSTLSTAGISAATTGAMIALSTASAIGDVSTQDSTNADITETVGGSATTGDTVSVQILDSGLSGGSVTKTYTVASGDTLSNIASGLATAINGDSSLSGIGVSASSASAVVTISSTSVNATTCSQQVSAGATETLTRAGGPSETASPGGGGRLQAVTNDAISNSDITYAYDELGRTINRSINGSGNSIIWNYDPMSRVTAELNQLGLFGYSYVDDTSGSSKGTTRLSSISYPNGQTTNFTWFGNSGDQRLKEIENLDPSSSTLSKFDYAYNAAGEITEWDQQHGDDPALQYLYKYDRAGQLTSAQAGRGGPGPSARQYLYSYDPAANRTGVQKLAVDTVTLGGTITADDTISVTVTDSSLTSDETVSYTVQSGDTLADVAANLAAAVTADAKLQEIGVNATSSASILMLRSASENVTTFSESLSTGATETVTANTVLNGTENAQIGGTVTAADVLTITVSDSGLSGGSESVTYTVQSGDTLADIASGLASAVNADSSLSTIGVSASSLDSTVNIKSVSSNFTSYTQSISTGGTETISLSANVNGIETAAIGGNPTNSDELTLTINDAGLSGGSESVSYTVGSSDALADIASGLASAINSDSTLSNIGVSATATSSVVNISSVSLHLTTCSQSISSGATETITLAPASAATQFAYNNVNELVSSQAGGSVQFQGTTNKAIKSGSVATNLITIKHNEPETRYSTDASLSAAQNLTAGQNQNGKCTVSVTGLDAGGGVTTLTTSNSTLSGGQATSTITMPDVTSALTGAVNTNTDLQQAGISATEGSSEVDLSVTGTTYKTSINAGATETITLGDNNQGNTTASIGGTPTTADVLTIAFHDRQLSGGLKSLSYTVQSGDSIVDIAAGLASALNADSDLSDLGVTASNSVASTLSDTKDFTASLPVNSGNNPVAVSAVDGGDNTTTNNLQLSVKGPGKRTYTFDENGNMSSDGVNSYEWDAEDRLVQIKYQGSNNYTSFTYGPLGVRRKTAETIANSVTSTKQFLGQEERDSSGSVARQFFSLGETISETPYFVVNDHLTSVTAMTSQSGNLQCMYSFDSFGLKDTIYESLSSDFQFAGLYFHNRSGLNLSSTRQYSPELGRWNSRDPVKETGGENLFAYVLNAPTMKIDPLGLQAIPSWYDPNTGQLSSPTDVIPFTIPDIPILIPPLIPPSGPPTPIWIPPVIPHGPHGKRSPRRRKRKATKRPKHCPNDHCDPPIARNPNWTTGECWMWCLQHCESHILGGRWNHCMNKCTDLPPFKPKPWGKPPFGGFPPYQPRQ